MAAAIARHAGARNVVITDVNPYRLELAKKMGATLTLDMRQTKTEDALKNLGMKEGFDVGMEMSGSPDALRAMLPSMCPWRKNSAFRHPAARHGDRLGLCGFQRVDYQGNLWPRNVRNLVQNDRHDPDRIGYHPHHYASFPLYRIRKRI